MYGDRIRETRKEKGYTQDQLARLLGLTRSTLGKYEREELQPNIETVLQLCKILDVSADYLLGRTEI